MFASFSDQDKTVFGNVTGLSFTTSLQIPMLASLREEWLTKLRSGEYVQGKRRLKTENPTACFCCLGVLCDITFTTHKIGKWEMGDGIMCSESILANCGRGDATGTTLPARVQKVAFPTTNPLWSPPLVEFLARLAAANDCGMSFAQIADMIEFHTVPMNV